MAPLRDLTPVEEATCAAALAEAYRDLESDICDLKLMSIVVETVFDDTMIPSSESSETIKVFRLTKDQWDGLHFIILQAGDRARSLEKRFYADWKSADPRRMAA